MAMGGSMRSNTTSPIQRRAERRPRRVNPKAAINPAPTLMMVEPAAMIMEFIKVARALNASGPPSPIAMT